MKRIILLCLWITLAIPSVVHAQQNLQIASVYKRYANTKGATMVELSNEMLETYEMKLYKSLTLRNPSEQTKSDVLKSLDNDKKKAKKIKEVIHNSNLQSGYYQLPCEQEDINCFILYKESKKGTITLIYIEGELDTDDLITLLFMKHND